MTVAYTKGMKTVEESRTEFIKLLKYEDINGQNRLFGGLLMAWIDEAAAVAAMRHAGGNVTTCAVDDLRFKKGAYLNDLLVLIARVTYVGNTSMEVRVDTYLEDLETGKDKELACDSVLLACGLNAKLAEADSLRHCAPETDVHIIGDAKEVRTIYEAVNEAFRTCLHI